MSLEILNDNNTEETTDFKMVVSKINCKWMVNGKTLDQLNQAELAYINAFFREVKLGTLLHQE